MKEKGECHPECANDPCTGWAPSIPPADYKGTQADWMVGLQEMGVWNGEGFHEDCGMTCKEWWTLLDRCEGAT